MVSANSRERGERMPRNGSAKVYRGLDFERHYAVSTDVLHVRELLEEVETLLLEGYGRNDPKAKLAKRLLDSLDLLRGHLNQSVLHEHHERPMRELSELYYPPER